MRLKSLMPVVALFAISACGGTKEDNQVTETRMDDLDSLEGTISDDIINLDTSTDEGPIEAATPSEAKPASKASDSDGAKNSTPDPTPVEEKAPAE